MKPDMIDLIFKTHVANECNNFASLYERSNHIILLMIDIGGQK